MGVGCGEGLIADCSGSASTRRYNAGSLWLFNPQAETSMPWSLDRARRTYAIAHWGEGYFDIDAQGRVVVQPQGPRGPAIALPEAVARALADGLKLPLLPRFSGILGHLRPAFQTAFDQAMPQPPYA